MNRSSSTLHNYLAILSSQAHILMPSHFSKQIECPHNHYTLAQLGELVCVLCTVYQSRIICNVMLIGIVPSRIPDGKDAVTAGESPMGSEGCLCTEYNLFILCDKNYQAVFAVCGGNQPVSRKD